MKINTLVLSLMLSLALHSLVFSQQQYKADLDTGFWNGSGVKIPKLTPKLSANLQLLGQTWGFLKYYHPAIAAGNFNWDIELIRILPDYVSAKSSASRDKVLTNLIEKLGPLSPCSTCKNEFPPTTKMKPDLRFLDSPDIGTDLRQKLAEIRMNRNQGNHYYVAQVSGVGNPRFTNEGTYGQFSYPDDAYRLIALFRYWNAVNYFFPYKYLIEEDWNNVLLEFIPKILEAKDRLQYRLVLLELIGRVHDTHANIWGIDTVLSNYHGNFRPALQTKFIEDKLVVTGYFDQKRGEETNLLPGDIITHINNRPVEKFVEENLKYFPASNYPTKLRDIARNILRTKSRSLDLKFTRDNKNLNALIQTFPVDSVNINLERAHSIPDSAYKLLTKDVGYIHLGEMQNKYLSDAFRKFKQTKGIVIDIRNYPKENLMYSLTSMFLSEPKPFVTFTFPLISYPGTFGFRSSPTKVGKDWKPNAYKGKVVVIVNEITQSSAEFHTMALQAVPNATVIGSTTAAADGNVSMLRLPGNILTMFSGIGVYYPDQKETQRVGIIPNIEVKPTIKGIREGRDEALEKAIALIEQ